MAKNIFERMGLVQKEESVSPVTPIPVDIEPSEPLPEVNTDELDHLNLISSIYTNAGIPEDNSIFKIKAYMDVLPAEMTTAKKQSSIAGILVLNNIDVANIISDGLQRTKLLEAAEVNIRANNDALINEAEEDIEKLKGLIEAAEAKIAEAKKNTADSTAAINAERETVSALLEFTEGILNNKEDS